MARSLVLGLIFGVVLCPVGGYGASFRPELLAHPTPDLARIPPENALAVPGPGVFGAAETRAGRRWNPHPHVLVVLADCADRQADSTVTPATVERLLFSLGEMPYGSLREYYRKASYGRMDVTGEVVGWYRLPRLYADYANDQSGLCVPCYPNNARQMVVDALQAVRDAGIDVTRFDDDGPDGIPASGDDDGIVDGFAVIFPGYGAERTGRATDIRAHFGLIEGAPSVQGIVFPDYAAFPALENVGDAVHEFGHLFGGIDLYDGTNRGAGLGYYSVMAYGLWFNNARSPGGPDAYTRLLWEVVDPEVLSADETGLSLAPVDSIPRVLRLWTRGEQGPEYFLLEHRRATGIDRFMYGDGLLLYHVDETAPDETDPHRYRVSIVQADGLGSLEGNDPRDLGDFGDYFPGLLGVRAVDDTTIPSTRAHDGSATSVAIRNIGDPAPEIPFDVEVGLALGGVPDPRLSVLPEGGVEDPGAVPGTEAALRLAVMNRGTRLAAGRLTVGSDDVRVHLAQPYEIDVPGIPALGTLDLDLPIRLLVDGVPAGSRAALPLQATWASDRGTFTTAAPIPLAGTLLLKEGFEAPNPEIRAVSLRTDRGPAWGRTRARHGEGEWSMAADTSGTYPYGVNEALELGPFPLSGASEIRFQQWVDLQAFGDYAYDGGFLEASNDGGATWVTLVPVGGYPYQFGYSVGNPYPNQPVWSGVRDVWEDVTVPIPLAGSVLLRFRFVSDATGGNLPYKGWFLDRLLVRSWDSGRAAVFGAPRVNGSDAVLPVEAFRFWDQAPPESLRVVRDDGIERTTLAAWNADAPFTDEVPVSGLSSSRVERFWLQWGDRGIYGPLVLGGDGATRSPLFVGTPGRFRRADGGNVVFRVPGGTTVPVTLDLIDVRGARVTRLVAGPLTPGTHGVAWPNAPGGARLAAGVYFLRLAGPGFGGTARVVLTP